LILKNKECKKMKKVLLLLCMFMVSLPMWGQDYIYTKSGIEIKAKVKEILTDEVLFTYYNQDDIIRHLKIEDVLKIKYEDGTIDDERFLTGKYNDNSDYTNGKMAFGVGIGVSTGTVGAKFEVPVPFTNYMNLHFGLGAGQSKAYGIDIGLKSYVYEHLGYVDVSLLHFDDENYISLTGGVDWAIVGRPSEKQFGINFGIGGVVDLTREAGDVLPGGDIGLFLRF
jgi:hypothetical protein